jgi:hypothetical protein
MAKLLYCYIVRWLNCLITKKFLQVLLAFKGYIIIFVVILSYSFKIRSMKKITIVLIPFFIISSIVINAQTLIDTNRVWNNLHQWPMGGPLPLVNETTTIRFGDDTTFGSFIYRKVLQSVDSLQLNYSVIGIIRQDISKKVFIRYLADSADRLLYDFNVSVGDSIDILNFIPIKLYVDTVDSVLIGNKFRKRIVLSNHGWIGEQWIETIGSLCGILASGYHFITGMKYDLLCFYENDTLKYHTPDFLSCYYNNVGTREIISEESFTLSPNPFSHFTRISFGQTYSDIALEVYNILGQRVAEIHYARCTEITLKRNGLSQGMYFLKITLEGKMAETKKIMISD